MVLMHYLSAVLFLVSAIHKLWNRQAEHFFTRFIVALLLVSRLEDTDAFFLIIPAIEIVSPMFRRYWRGKS